MTTIKAWVAVACFVIAGSEAECQSRMTLVQLCQSAWWSSPAVTGSFAYFLQVLQARVVTP